MGRAIDIATRAFTLALRTDMMIFSMMLYFKLSHFKSSLDEAKALR